VRVVDLADARAAVVLSAGREGGRMEGVDARAILGRERHVHAVVRPPLALRDPEEGEVVAVSADPVDRLHHERHPQRRERLVVEGLAGLVVAHIQPNVVEFRRHGWILRVACVRALPV